MIRSRRAWIAIGSLIFAMVVLTVATLGALVVNANPGTSTPPHAGAVSRCLDTQLSAKPGRAGVAAGSVGQAAHLTNTSRSDCTLEGYPGLQLLDSAGHPLATEVHRGSSVTVQPLPVRLVTLAPHGEASFNLGYADATGFGNERCPTSAHVEITPPNDSNHLTISWRLQPYGGDIPHLRCGEITVSPVFAGK